MIVSENSLFGVAADVSRSKLRRLTVGGYPESASSTI
jgi:hypothetical protein